MNPINIICDTCGRDVLIEPEVFEEECPMCTYCKGFMFEWDREEYEKKGV